MRGQNVERRAHPPLARAEVGIDVGAHDFREVGRKRERSRAVMAEDLGCLAVVRIVDRGQEVGGRFVFRTEGQVSP
jgi:hypothetical protein